MGSYLCLHVCLHEMHRKSSSLSQMFLPHASSGATHIHTCTHLICTRMLTKIKPSLSQALHTHAHISKQAIHSCIKHFFKKEICLQWRRFRSSRGGGRLRSRRRQYSFHRRFDHSTRKKLKCRGGENTGCRCLEPNVARPGGHKSGAASKVCQGAYFIWRRMYTYASISMFVAFLVRTQRHFVSVFWAKARSNPPRWSVMR
jgi:hypothetical protein